MNQKDFEGVVNETMRSIHQLLAVKGGEYAGSADRLANFKRGANLTGCTPLQVLFVYLSKHYDAVATYVRKDAASEKQILSEPIDGRLDDIINYCLLAKALICEARNANPVPVPDRDSDERSRRLSPSPLLAGHSIEDLQQALHARGEPGMDRRFHGPEHR